MIFGKSQTQKTLEYNLKTLKNSCRVIYTWFPCKLSFLNEQKDLNGKWIWLGHVVRFDYRTMQILHSGFISYKLRERELKSCIGDVHWLCDYYKLDNYKRGDKIDLTIFDDVTQKSMAKVTEAIEYIEKQLEIIRNDNSK